MTQDKLQAHVAQLVEHVLGKDEVTRSIRVVGSMHSWLWRRAEPELIRCSSGVIMRRISKGVRYGEGEI